MRIGPGGKGCGKKRTKKPRIDKKRGFFDMGYVKKILDRHQMKQRNYGAHIWSLVCFELWNRIYMDCDNMANDKAGVGV